MEFPPVLMISTLALVLLCSPSAYAQRVSPPSPASLIPTPAPAPGPNHVNLTYLLTYAGPFKTFLGYLESTKVISTFQDRANSSEDGITIFVPKDQAFSSLKSPSLSNLTADQLKSLCLFHALPRFYSLSDFKNVSQMNPLGTLAGGQYTLNFTDVSGTVHINSGWTDTKVSSSVLSNDRVAVYQVDRVLLPIAIFGTDIPPAAAPAPAPVVAASPPEADAPSGVADNNGPSPAASRPNSSCRIAGLSGLGGLLLAASTMLAFLL
ncbi:fasciclin-like arabinogalactan protein 7 isoform X2 [Punica granatum]|nr:fasciclin-like arabinogalactan protein 7 isoform X2 [Punica granatum]XP_031384098.1 fasciclin-like arabinogalactan protein 7 isoform X2 [Punica granatum]XP_031384099.1 fasciclin-like arabinogalactan protein 7 isoform X2 [Punica granatum]PKI35523.1 hypothetical protein CRG98_043977 [Punica granatum]